MSDNTQQPLLNHRFYVQVEGMTEAVFTALGAITLEIVPVKYAEGGNADAERAFIGPRKHSNLVLKRGMTASDDFLSWILGLQPGKVDRRSLTLIQYDGEGNKVRRLNFKQAFPIKWVSAEWSAPDGIIAIESLELVHEGMALG